MSKNQLQKADPTPEKQFSVMGEQLTVQYKKAVSGQREIVIFGAMVMTVQKIVSTCGHDRSRGGGRDTSGEGFKAWLEKYAPEVSRPTAYRFLKITEGIRDAFQIGLNTDIANLLTVDPKTLKPSHQKQRRQIEEAIEGTSQRQLLINFGGVGVAEPKRRGGHHPATENKTDGDTQDERNPFTPAEQAKVMADGLTERLAEFFLTRDTRKKLWVHLPKNQLRELDELLMDCRAEIKEALK